MNKYHSEIICLVPTAKMKKNKTRELLLLSLASCVVIVQGCACFARAVPFADNGTLKMLYDNRMHPQALEHNGSVYIVWRGLSVLLSTSMRMSSLISCFPYRMKPRISAGSIS